MPAPDARDRGIFEQLRELASEHALRLDGAVVRRSSSRYCLGVEHGDYNGTSLFGVGTDRFLWCAYRPNGSARLRLVSGNFPAEGRVEIDLDAVAIAVPAAGWGRYAVGVVEVLRSAGLTINEGLDVALLGDIPGGGMSRSASLCVNLILTILEANGIEEVDRFRVAEWAQAVENHHIGSPCGLLDPLMILFAQAGHGTLFEPGSRTVTHLPFGGDDEEFRLVALDTGTVRPGLEQSTYRLRRAECEALLAMAQDEGFGIASLAEVREPAQLDELRGWFGAGHPDWIDRLEYLFRAQQNLTVLLEAWRAGDAETVGQMFRRDGHGLRDLYRISGPELETMCDLVRTVPGVLGERMLGGGDKGAAGAIVRPAAVAALREAVATGYPRAHPALAERYAVHELRTVDGVVRFEGVI